MPVDWVSRALRQLLLLALLVAAGGHASAAEPAAPPAAPSFEEVLLAAQEGDVTAQLTVGSMYEDRGALTNALRWYQAAAAQNSPGGQFKLGLYHAQGVGVERDFAAAFKWFDLAARQGFAPAHYNLGLCHEKGLGTPRDLAAALKHYRLAAAQNDLYAQKALGVFHEKGFGVTADLPEAYKWYSLAAQGGLSDAELLRTNLLKRLPPAQLREAEQRLARHQAGGSAATAPKLAAEAPAKPKAKTKDFLD